MDTAATVVVSVLFMVIGILLAIYARRIVNWIYEKTMNFWTRTVDPERRNYTDERYRNSWYWKAWWAWSVWVYRIIGVLIALYFAGLLFVAVIK